MNEIRIPGFVYGESPEVHNRKVFAAGCRYAARIANDICCEEAMPRYGTIIFAIGDAANAIHPAKEEKSE